MSLKRILGTMLVSQMAGRGRRRGGGLGTAAMLGGLGYRRGGMARKAGLASLGYMAYRAYQDHQARSANRPQAAASTGGGMGAAGAGGGLGGMLQGLADQLTGGGGAQAQTVSDAELREDEALADRISDDTALLLLRAMITAAYADGSLSQDERARILQGIDESDPTPSERATMEREIANPRPLDDLLTEVRDAETAQQFYLASTAAIDTTTPENRRYLDDLRRRLDVSDEAAAEAEQMAG